MIPGPEGSLCIKVERTDDPTRKFRQLHAEAKIYELLRHEKGFPEARQFGKEATYNFLAMELLGPDLFELLLANCDPFSLKSVCIMAFQMISRLERLHCHNLIHRDVKPSNFLIGRNEKASTIYLCDMGFCLKYRDKDTRRHTPHRRGLKMTGTGR